MVFLTATLCFIAFVILIKEAISSERLKKRILYILGSIFLFLLGIIYFLIFLIEIFLK